jgi:hypothetical protein
MRLLLATLLLLLAGAVPPALAGPAVPALDHFLCYRSKTVSGTPKFTPRPDTALVDAFGARNAIVFAERRLCTPTDKNGEDPSAPGHPDHLSGYQLRKVEPHFARVHGVTVTNQLGTLIVDLVKPDLLLAPTATSLTAPPGPPTTSLDHFVCYKVRRSSGAARFEQVRNLVVEDQFGTLVVDIKTPRKVCLPADVDGTTPGAAGHAGALFCYKAKTSRGTPPFARVSPLFIHDQLGPHTVDARKLDEICLPSAMS